MLLDNNQNYIIANNNLFCLFHASDIEMFLIFTTITVDRDGDKSPFSILGQHLTGVNHDVAH
jgi:hypothetical protein